MSSLTVACVLRSGGEYGPKDVNRLRDGVAEYLPGARFVCLVDMALLNVEYAYLHHDWPGWWAKIELFRPGLFSGRVLYIDLDTAVVGPLHDIAAVDAPFVALADFNEPRRLQSSVLAWDAGVGEAIYRDFVPQADAIMATPSWSDQHWMDAVLRGKYARWQDVVPGQVVSWKRHCRDGVPNGARLVCFHGRPKFADLPPNGLRWAA